MFSPGRSAIEYVSFVPVEYPMTGDVVTLLDALDTIQKADPARGRNSATASGLESST